MLKRFPALILLIISLFLGIMPVAAAGSPWQAWLYEDSIGRMTLVDDSGATLRELILPGGPGSAYSREAAVSSDGKLVGYTNTAAGAETTAVRVYDTTSNTVILDTSIPADAYHSFNFKGSRYNFSEGNGSFAFGYAHPGVGWQVVAVNLTALSLTVLQPASPGAVSAGIDAGFGFLVPTIQYNRSGEVMFTMIAAATEGMPQYDSFTWNTLSGVVSRNQRYITLDNDTLSLTGEVIMSLHDERFPGGIMPETGFLISNTLQVFEPVGSARNPIYSLIDEAPFSPQFIEGGERIVFKTYDARTITNRWHIMQRSGVIAGSLAVSAPSDNFTSVAGLLNGLIYTAGIFTGGESGGTTLYYVETRLASPPYTATSVWNSPLGAAARIVWVSDNEPVAPTLTAWTSIPVPTPSSGGTDSSAGSSPARALIIGGTATVFTSDGDLLNVRSGPGTSFSRIAQLAPGVVVTILEGPTAAEGFNWWRIRIPAGLEGWAVDYADSDQTLVPGGSATSGSGPSGPAALLTIGGQADVIATGGSLRLRSGPGLTFGIVREMTARTRVTILEGPRSADGLNWWRMRLSDATEGWAADNIGGQPTLAPASISPPPPATTILAAPTLLSPANGVLLTNFPRTTTLQWASVPGAASYTLEVQYCESPSSCATYITSGGMGGTNYVFDFIGDQPGRWRVKAVGSSGTESNFSEWWMFSYNTAGTGLPAPGLISPASGAVFNNFPRTTELRWTSVTGASYYIVEIQYCQTGLVNCVSYPLVDGNISTAYTFEFIGAQPGRWRVKSVSSSGVEGAWSEWWSFTYNV